MRYNKKKRGAYKEAIRQATGDAQAIYENSPTSSPLPNVSPQPIDVSS